MTINEAMDAASAEYNQEVEQSKTDPRMDWLIRQVMAEEYREIERELPSYVMDIARAMGVPVGTILPHYVYQAALMCFRFGMRTQRKLDHPGEKTTLFWRSGVAQ